MDNVFGRFKGRVSGRFLFYFLLLSFLTVSIVFSVVYDFDSVNDFDVNIRNGYSFIIQIEREVNQVEYPYIALYVNNSIVEIGNEIIVVDYRYCDGVSVGYKDIDHTGEYCMFPVSIGGWVKHDDTQIDTYGQLVFKDENYQLMVLDNGTVAVVYYDSVGVDWRSVITTDTVVNLDWSSVYAVLGENGTDTNVCVYIDNVLVENVTLTGQPSTYTGSFGIGWNDVLETDRFKGEIANLVVYNGTLSTSDVNLLSSSMGMFYAEDCSLEYAGDTGGVFEFTPMVDSYLVAGFNYDEITPTLVNGAGGLDDGEMFLVQDGVDYRLVWNGFDLVFYNMNMAVGMNIVVVVIFLFAPIIGLFLLGLGKWSLPVGLTLGAILGYAFMPLFVSDFVFPEWVLFAVFIVDVAMFIAIWRGGG